jgi:hypothetical protein
VIEKKRQAIIIVPELFLLIHVQNKFCYIVITDDVVGCIESCVGLRLYIEGKHQDYQLKY